MEYRVDFKGREMVSEDILVFRIGKPEGYAFSPGQFCFLTFPDLGFQDEKGLRKHLSIASSPGETELLFATKVSGSAFKKTLMALRTGAEIVVEHPMGKFTLPEHIDSPVIFLAGGIGITPFRSILRHIVDTGKGFTVTLFYSARVPGEAVFLEELQSLAAKHDEIFVVPTMTRIEQGSGIWRGLTGRISPEMIKEYAAGWQKALYYAAGPPPLAEATQKMLGDMGIFPQKVHVEKFTGY